MDRQRHAAPAVAGVARAALSSWTTVRVLHFEELTPDRTREPSGSGRRDLDERSTMFTLSIALLAFALILGAFGVLGVAGGSAIVASLVVLLGAAISMVAYWRRRPVWALPFNQNEGPDRMWLDQLFTAAARDLQCR
jgi:hypothetical protein